MCLFLVLGTTSFGASPPVKGVEHWVDNGPIRLYVWEKYVEDVGHQARTRPPPIGGDGSERSLGLTE